MAKPKIEVEKVYRCPVCGSIYETIPETRKCINSTQEPIFEVGDILEIRYGFGWYDGDRGWIINPEVDVNQPGFGKETTYGFYYVVTHVNIDKHRVYYHVATKAMIGGHRSGYFSLSDIAIEHSTYPRKIEAPKKIIEESKDLLGKVSERHLY